MAVVHETGMRRHRPASRVTSVPFVFRTRMPLRRALPSVIPRPSTLVVKRVVALRPSATQDFVAILPVTFGGYQAIPSIDNSTFSVYPEALPGGRCGSPATVLRFKTA